MSFMCSDLILFIAYFIDALISFSYMNLATDPCTASWFKSALFWISVLLYRFWNCVSYISYICSQER